MARTPGFSPRGDSFRSLDYVVAEARLDDPGDLPGREGERGILEGFDHLTVAESPERTPAGCCSRLVGKFHREPGKVAARFRATEHLFGHRVCLITCANDRRRCVLGPHPLDQN